MMINHALSPLLETNTNLKVTKYIHTYILKRILLDSFPISMLVFFKSRTEIQNAKQTIHDLKSERKWCIKRAHTLDKKCQEEN